MYRVRSVYRTVCSLTRVRVVGSFIGKVPAAPATRARIKPDFINIKTTTLSSRLRSPDAPISRLFLRTKKHGIIDRGFLSPSQRRGTRATIITGRDSALNRKYRKSTLARVASEYHIFRLSLPARDSSPAWADSSLPPSLVSLLFFLFFFFSFSFFSLSFEGFTIESRSTCGCNERRLARCLWIGSSAQTMKSTGRVDRSTCVYSVGRGLPRARRITERPVIETFCKKIKIIIITN